MDLITTVQLAGSVVDLLKGMGISPEKALKSAIEGISNRVPSREELQLSSQEDVKHALREAYLSEKLVPVLGAGTSIEYGLPSWNTLLQALLARTFQSAGDNDAKALLFAEVFSRIFDPSPLIAARYLAGQFQDKRQGFEGAIQKLLYDQIKPDFTSDTMKEIVQLAAAPGKSPNLDSIITYNFDDVLEEELRKASIQVPFRSIFTVGQNPTENELPIFHVHGFIPREGTLSAENEITLGENLYHQQYTNIYNWANLVQLSKFKDSHCLFMGTSLTDPNQRRLLDIANTLRGNSSMRHFIIKRRYPHETIEERLRSLLEANKDIFDEKVMHNIQFSELVQAMLEAVHKFDEKDASSLGVQTVWVDEFKEVPEVLKQMRI